MCNSHFSALIVCVGVLAFCSTPAQAQDAYASSNAPLANAQAVGSTPVAEAPATRVVVGRVKTTAGALPGAIIKIAGSRQMVVADADGSFHVTVPANSGPVQATASYAGFADEAITLNEISNEVSMTTPRVIRVAKGQSLQAYRKTAHKQVKRSIRRVQKSVK